MEIGHQEALWPGCMAHSYKSIFKDRINRTEGGFMLGNVRKKFIGDKQFYKMVLAIAIPIMIQNGITNFVSLLDNIMVGQILSLIHILFSVLLFVGENVNILVNEHETKNTCRGEKTHCRYSSATERNKDVYKRQPMRIWRGCSRSCC